MSASTFMAIRIQHFSGRETSRRGVGVGTSAAILLPSRSSEDHLEEEADAGASMVVYIRGPPGHKHNEPSRWMRSLRGTSSVHL